jgi:sporulation protein YlmC with PRC-barrel domain
MFISFHNTSSFLLISALLFSAAQDPSSKPPAQGKPQQPTSSTPTTTSTPRETSGLSLQRGDKLIGMEVRDRSGARVAQIDDVILLPNGEIAYAVLAGSGPEGQKLYPVPWKSVQVHFADDRAGDPKMGDPKPGDPKAGDPKPDTSAPRDTPGSARTDHATLSIEKDRWTTGPSFDRSGWPTANRELYDRVDTFYGTTRAKPDTGTSTSGKPVEAGAALTSTRGTQLTRQSIVDSTGATVGTINQVVFDPSQARVNYVAVVMPAREGAAARTIAVPFEALRYSRADDKSVYTLSTPADRLQNAPEFRTGDEGWKQMSDPKWVNQLYTYYAVRPYWNTTDRAPSSPGGGPGNSNEGPR